MRPFRCQPALWLLLCLLTGLPGLAEQAAGQASERSENQTGERSADKSGFAAAAEHYRQQHWAEACQGFQQFLAAEPNHARANTARFLCGESLVQLNRWEEARGQFTELLKRDPDGRHAKQAQFRVGEAAYMLGDDRAAQTALDAFRERFPDDPLNAYVLVYLGSVELQLKDARAAEKNYLQALAKFKDGPLAGECQLGLAQALQQLGKWEAAQQTLTLIAGSEDPLAEPALFQLGATENELEHFDAAAKAFEELAKRFPESSLIAKSRVGYGYALYKLGRSGEAQRVLTPLLSEAPTDRNGAAEGIYWLALAQKADEQWGAAVETLRRVQLADEHALAPAVAYHLADALARDGQPAAASTEFDKALTRFSRSAWADDCLLGKLRIALEQKDYEASVGLADELSKKYPDSPLRQQARLAKGQSLVALNQPAEAIKALEPLTSLPPEAASRELYAQALSTLAVCHAQLKEFDEAEQIVATLRESGDPSEVAAAAGAQVAELAQAAGESKRAEKLFSSVSAASSDKQSDTKSSSGASDVTRRAHTGLAWNHFQAQRWAEAAEAFDKVLKTDPTGPAAAEAALLRGRSLEALEQFDAAQEMYALVSDKYAASTQSAEALWRAARLYEKQSAPAEALARYQQLLERHPDFSEIDAAIYRTAWLLRGSDAPAAGELFKRLQTDFPTSRYAADATLRLAEAAVEQEQFADAESLLKTISEAPTPDAVRQHALYLLGRAAIGRRDWAAAEAPFERLLHDFPEGELALSATYWRAEARYRQGDYEQAVTRLAELSTQTKDRTDAWIAVAELRRAQALAHLRRWPESLEVARAIGVRFPEFEQQYEVDYLIGRGLAAEADLAGARDSYAKVIASSRAAGTQTLAMARWMRGESFFHQEDYAAALKEYSQVDEEFPRWHAAALLQAGKCREALGEWRTAAELYQQVLLKYPTGELSAEASNRLTAMEKRASAPTESLK